ncbi:MAG: hypothetical protein KDG57_13945, partial [Rhodoferax sp.]|nr:hypothetical protein [Rhodoferax sp.]
MKHSLLNIAAVALLTGCSSGGSNSPATPAPAPSASPSTPAAGQAGGSAPAAQTPGAAPTPAVNQVNPVSVGFYGQRRGQHAETAGWVNAAWECFWDDDNEAGAIENLRHGVPTTLDVYGYLYVVGNDSSGLRPDAEQRLRGLFDRLRAAGVLQHVAAVTPIDEPNIEFRYKGDSILEAAALIRRVMADYPELVATKLAVLFCTHRPMIGIEAFDIVYFDLYAIERGTDGGENKDPVLVLNGWAERVDKMLRPDQEMGLVPGGSDLNYLAPDVDAYVAKARTF